ncbi:MAG: prepilin-type N-terminal cleavage/methylation domain-containing protein, partial [Sideroxydans sp.]
MSEARNENRGVLTESVMLSRLQKSDEMREFIIEMWKQNPTLAKQGGARVQNLLSVVDSKQRGISLIELIIFIVIISVALTGILLVMNTVTRHSADPLIHKQALAIAESLLEEVELMPFSYCDPDDASAVVATSPADCTGGAGGPNDEDILGPETAASVGGAEGRYAAPQFDNVGDYHGFSMVAGSVVDITGGAAVGGYSASISVAQTALGTVPAGDSLRITVTVTGP